MVIRCLSSQPWGLISKLYRWTNLISAQFSSVQVLLVRITSHLGERESVVSERRVSLIYRLVCPFLVSTYVKMMVIRYWSSQSILARPSQFISSQLNSTQLKCDVVGNSIYRVRFDSSITTRRDTRSISVITRLKKVYRFDLTEVRFTEIKHNTSG